MRLGAGAALGFLIGVQGANQVQTSFTKSMDEDILQAFDQRYINTVLNSTGFGNNYVSISDNAVEMTLKKPY